MRIFLITLIDVGFIKIIYRLIFEIKKIFYFITPSIILDKLFFYNKKNIIWDKELFLDFQLSLYPPKFYENNKKIFYFKFLNEKRKIYFPYDWNNKSQSTLWNFNLHYFNWAREWLDKAIDKSIWGSDSFYIGNIIDNWIDNNQIGKGNAWNSYTISLRTRNWIWLFRCCPNLATKKRIVSLWEQMIWLYKNKEKCYGGNHLLENLTSLLICSIQFKDKDSIVIFKNSLNFLKKELDKQILLDGGHEERSASYHLLILDRLLEVVSSLRIAQYNVPSWLTNKINLMYKWAVKVKIGNNLFPRFNDSPLDGSPKISTIIDFSEDVLKIKKGKNLSGLRSLFTSKNNNFLNTQTKIENISRYTDLKQTGWILFRPNKKWEFIIKCGEPCPRNLPAHVHSDLLSFDLFYDGKPVIAELGTSSYEKNKIRSYERSGAGHNVLQVSNIYSKNNKFRWIEPVEVWGNFRAGRKAKIILRESGIKNNSLYWVKGIHDGFKKINTSYQRQIELKIENEDDLSLTCIETIKCNKSIYWKQIWHPGPLVNFEVFKNIIDKNYLCLNVKSNIINTWYASKFGERIKRKSLYYIGKFSPGEYTLRSELHLSKNIFLK